MSELLFHILAPLLDMSPECMIPMNQNGGLLKDDSVLNLVALAQPTRLTQPLSDSPPTNIADQNHKVFIFDRDLLGPDAEQVAVNLTIDHDQVLTEPPLNRKLMPSLPVATAFLATRWADARSPPISSSRGPNFCARGPLGTQPGHFAGFDSVDRAPACVATGRHCQPGPSHSQHKHSNQPLHRPRKPQSSFMVKATTRNGTSPGRHQPRPRLGRPQRPQWRPRPCKGR